MTKIQNKKFDRKKGFDRGMPLFVEALWYLIKINFFLTPFPWPSSLKRFLLRAFGAKVGRGVVIKPRVNVTFPWKFSIGDYSWIGEESFLLNLEAIHVGSQCCISQRAFLCTGNHDYHSTDMSYRNMPIQISDGAWVGAQVFVGPGVNIGVDAVISAGSVVTKDLSGSFIYSGNPCVPIKSRWKNK